MRSALSAALLLLGPALCLAQSNVATSCIANPANTAAAPMIGEAASAQLAVVRECVAKQDGDCAEAALDEIDDDDFNDDELAVLTIARGDTEALQGSSRRARREYGRVLRMDDANRQLGILAIERITIRHVEDGDYDDALDALEDLDCGEWTPEMLYLQARARFGESEFEGAQDSAQAAIDARASAGGTAPQHWHSLIAASAQRAQQAATEQVVCTQERRSNSNIPIRVCTTRAQRQAEAAAAGDLDGDLVRTVETIQ